jgi:competence protein ComEC
MKFYQRPWFMWLTIILFAPVGIFLLWKYSKINKQAKIALSVVFGLFFINVAASGGIENTGTTSDKVTNEPTKQVAKQNEEDKTKQETNNKVKQEAAEKAMAEEEQKKPEEVVIVKTEETKPAEATSGVSVNCQLKVHFIDVGQADSILVQQGSSAMLVDAGNNGDSGTIKSYLDKQGVNELQYFVGTHKDEDHIGSADYIINSFKVGKVYFPKQTATTKTFEDFVIAVKNKGLNLTVPVVGSTFKIGDATATILAPNGSGYSDSNDYSIVLKVTFGKTSFLLTGDAEEDSESEMLSKGLDLSATVLKVSHHGSKTSTGQSFLNKVNPKYAVISVGEGNSYEHPNQEALDRLKAKSIPVYRTDENGTIVATSNGVTVTFDTNPGSYTGIVSSSSSKNSDTSSKDTSTNKTKPKPAPTEKKTVTVYITETGSKYHKDGCRYLRKSKIPISLDDAKQGYDPCSVCDPPQ